MTCYLTQSSQVCSNSGVCTAPPERGAMLIGEAVLQQTAEFDGISFKSAKVEVSSGEFKILAVASVQIVEANIKQQSVTLSLTEKRTSFSRSYLSRGNVSAEFSYKDLRTYPQSYEIAENLVSCSLE